MNKETEQLLLAFEEWTLFAKTLSRLEEKTWNSSLEKGKWTIKSIVSHMMLWDRYFYREAIEKIALNQQITLKHVDFDEFNRKAVEYGNRTEPSEIVDKAITYRHKIMNDIRGYRRNSFINDMWIQRTRIMYFTFPNTLKILYGMTSIIWSR